MNCLWKIGIALAGLTCLEAGRAGATGALSTGVEEPVLDEIECACAARTLREDSPSERQAQVCISVGPLWIGAALAAGVQTAEWIAGQNTGQAAGQAGVGPVIEIESGEVGVAFAESTACDKASLGNGLGPARGAETAPAVSRYHRRFPATDLPVDCIALP